MVSHVDHNDNHPPARWLWIASAMMVARLYFPYGHDAAMEFRVWDAATVYEPGQTEADARPVIIRSGSDIIELADWESVEDKAELRGALRFDGCINWETGHHCMAHGCGPSWIDRQATMFKAIYAVGHELMSYVEEVPMPDGVKVIMDEDIR